MKVKLFVLAALILVSSITSIFNSIPIIGVSAQEYEEINDGSNGNEEMVENYSYDEEPSLANTDNGYNNNFDPSMDEQNSEYSSYNSYEPASYDNGEEKEYSSYDNYENSYNSEYVNDDYSSDNSGSYEKEYSENSYDENYYPPKEPKTYTCPDSGIVVDYEADCPVVCPDGTALEGHLVLSGSNLEQVCNEEQLDVCGVGTDLEGVFVSNAPGDCNIFDTCGASTPLGRELGLIGAQTVEVADDRLCQLTIPDGGQQLTTCAGVANSNLPPDAIVTDQRLCTAAIPAVQCGGATTLEGVWVVPPATTEKCNIDFPPPVETFPCDGVSGNNLPPGARVTNIELCRAATPAVQCVSGDLQGVWVHPSQQAAICSIDIPPTVPCDGVSGNNLPPGAVVTNIELCRAATPAVQCVSGDLQGVWVHPSQQAAICSIDIPTLVPCDGVSGNNLPPGAVVTNIELCRAATPAVQCPAPIPGVPGSGSDLAGVWVDPADIQQCNISPADITLERNPQAQCLKCADLAVHFSGNNAEEPIANALIGTTTSNLFTVCQATDPRPGFNTLIPMGCTGACPTTPPPAPTPVESAFSRCLTNAGNLPGTEPRTGDTVTVPPPSIALQENSLTTNIEPQSEIPMETQSEITTFSPLPPSIVGVPQ